ncbi:MAG: hypothetical protein M3Y42_20535 [Actinomycetota bacterium]|nr:hypothetical protein [Actinomycetota bacterium]MDQ2959334.1 hypothetical protein [Actinomycetota bacterium]
MAPARTRTAQQRDARELALTRPADPYRGSLTDPFYEQPAANYLTGVAGRPPSSVHLTGLAEPASAPPASPMPAGTLDYSGPSLLPSPDTGRMPGPATLAGILGIALGVTLALFGMLLLAILSLQHEYGAPDRSFYRGTDSGYVVLALLDFGVALGCAIGAIMLLTGRVAGRVAITVSGWATLILAAFWLLIGQTNPVAPLIIAVAAALMLLLSYQRTVTRWLGVLPAPQPD